MEDGGIDTTVIKSWQRTLTLLNLYGCQAVQSKLKKVVKIHFLCFYPFFELMLDSLTAIKVEPHHCPSHHFILLTLGPIHEIFAKKKLRIGEAET